MSKLLDGLKMGGLRLEFVRLFSCVCNVHTVKRTRCKKSKKPAPGAKKQNLAPQVSLIKFKGHLPPASMYDSHSLRERTEFLFWLFSRIFVKEISNVKWFGKRILFSPLRVNARASKNSWTAQVWKRKQVSSYTISHPLSVCCKMMFVPKTLCELWIKLWELSSKPFGVWRQTGWNHFATWTPLHWTISMIKCGK